jgi:hypothetical protein
LTCGKVIMNPQTPAPMKFPNASAINPIRSQITKVSICRILAMLNGRMPNRKSGFI